MNEFQQNKQFIQETNYFFLYFLPGYPFWQYWIDCQDPRTAEFFLANTSPYPILTVMGFYLYFSMSLGPRLMRDRKPFENLKPLMLVYNFTMAICNAYFVTLVLYHCEYGMRFVDWVYPDRNNRSPKAMYEVCSMKKSFYIQISITIVSFRKSCNYL